jgi:uncharacterized glyoxalase superfamily protein PhnB
MRARPGVIPMIAYEDGPRAMEWLAQAFGFRERHRNVTPDGRLSQGEMETDHGVIMLATPTPHHQGPRHHRLDCVSARMWSEVPYVIDGALVYVDDVRAHLERASAAGATILSEVEEGRPGLRYRAEDLEGHRWMFVQSPDGPEAGS